MRMRIKRVNYEEAVNYIEEIPKFTKKTALDHTFHAHGGRIPVRLVYLASSGKNQ